MSMLDQCPSCGGICGYTKKTGCQYRAEPVKSEWQPIETAPKDGKAFLMFLPGYGGYVADQRYKVLHYIGWGGGVWSDGGMGKYSIDEPTHWMPLPEAPK